MSKIDLNAVFPGWETDGILGSGVFGTVYLAHSQVDGRPVYGAVKVITTPPTPQAVESAMGMGISRDLLKTYFDKFKNDLNWELTMFGTVNSPNLVKVDAVAMEDLPEAGWVGYIRTGVYTPMKVYFDKMASTPEDAARLGAELASGLKACGEYGMVHGDVTPSNVMVSDAGTFLLGDFGVRRCLQKAGTALYGLTQSGFEAPELAKDAKHTVQTDIYALGATMCYVANGGSLPENGDPASIPDMDAGLAKIIKKAMAQNPADRYATAEEMRAAICALDIYTKRRPQRRAVAAATAFDLVKRNGSTIRGEAGIKAPEKPAVRAPEKTETPAEEKKPVPEVKPQQWGAEPQKKKKSDKKKIIIWSAIALAAILAIIALVVFNPFGDSDLPDDTHSPGNEQTDNNNGDNVIPELPDDVLNPDNTDDPDDTTDPGDNSGTVDPGTDTPDHGDNTDPGTVPDDKTDPGDNTDPDDEDNQPVDSYILPTDTVRLTADDLEGMGDEETTLAINEIYARHGKIFKNEDIQSYFESQDWYTPVSKDSADAEAKFTAIERDNLKTIIQYQKDMGFRGGGTGTTTPPTQEPDEPDPPVTEPEPPQVEPTRNDYLFPTDTTLITYEDMEGMDRSQTYMLINEIYARYGKTFKTASVQEYFDSQAWYTRKTDSYFTCEQQFNDTEWANIETIMAFQREKGYKD